jgi:hypothetical protein
MAADPNLMEILTSLHNLEVLITGPSKSPSDEALIWSHHMELLNRVASRPVNTVVSIGTFHSGSAVQSEVQATKLGVRASAAFALTQLGFVD